MDPIGRPNDDFRKKLTVDQIHSICRRNGIPRPTRIEPEERGNEKVIYYLDDRLAMQFLAVERDVEALRLLEHIDEIPTAQVITWSKSDPDVGVSCLITTRCPGTRLDALWRGTDDSDKADILRAVGKGMSRYHSVSPDSAIHLATDLGYDSLTGDDRSRERTFLEGRRERVRNRIDNIAALLHTVDDHPDELLAAIRSHLDSASPARLLPFGLTHPEPWVEHYIVGELDGGYALTGCIDIEWLKISDPGVELTVLYATILAHSEEWWDAFADGYSTHHTLPDDARERCHDLAIDFDAWSLSSSAGDALLVDGEVIDDGNHLTAWRTHCGRGHARRLRWLLGLDPDYSEVLFRSDIGPW